MKTFINYPQIGDILDFFAPKTVILWSFSRYTHYCCLTSAL